MDKESFSDKRKIRKPFFFKVYGFLLVDDQGLELWFGA